MARRRSWAGDKERECARGIDEHGGEADASPEAVEQRHLHHTPAQGGGTRGASSRGVQGGQDTRITAFLRHARGEGAREREGRRERKDLEAVPVG